MQTAVSNTSPIIILAKTDNLNLLRNVFNKILIPQTVYNEIVFKNDISAQRLKAADYISLTKVSYNQTLQSLYKILDKGEAEAIALSIELDLLLIIDEKKGRNLAKNYKLKIIGFLGILFLNYEKKFIDKERVLQIIEHAEKLGYRLSESLKNEFIKNII